LSKKKFNEFYTNETCNIEEIQYFDKKYCYTCKSFVRYFLVEFSQSDVRTPFGIGVLLLEEDELVILN